MIYGKRKKEITFGENAKQGLELFTNKWICFTSMPLVFVSTFGIINKVCDAGFNHSHFKMEDFNRVTCHNGVFIMSHFVPKLSV